VTPWAHQLVQVHLPMMLTGVLVCVVCGLLGNFLVLRRQSLLGDAVSHAVLPGLVLAFLLFGLRSPGPMFVGAAAAGVSAALLIELLRRLGRIEAGAAMAVVFTIYFALGVLLLEQAAARHVDLDADCVLMGQIEDLALRWVAPDTWSGLYGLDGLGALPRQTKTLMVLLVGTALFIGLFYKELKITSFDPDLATALGISAGAMHVTLIVFVAGAVVASFEAVGSILVIAMLICPAATARMLTDRLATQLWLSAVVGVMTGVGGHLLAAWGPRAVGADIALNSAGMMSVVAGVLLVGAVVFSPTHGVLAKKLRALALAVRIAREDLVAMLYCAEQVGYPTLSRGDLVEGVASTDGRRWIAGIALRRAQRRELEPSSDGWRLTERGRAVAAEVIRSHRLWEAYLIERLGLRPDHVHETAMRLEHLRTGRADDRLAPDEALRPDDAALSNDPHRHRRLGP